MTDAELIALRLECFDRFATGTWTLNVDGVKNPFKFEEMLEYADQLVAWALLGLEVGEVRTMVDGDLQ